MLIYANKCTHVQWTVAAVFSRSQDTLRVGGDAHREDAVDQGRGIH